MPTEFTPISALIGGLLIGVAAAGMMLVSGRIAGISGLVARLLPPAESEGLTDRVAFLLGLLMAPLLWLLATGEDARVVGVEGVQRRPTDAFAHRYINEVQVLAASSRPMPRALREFSERSGSQRVESSIHPCEFAQ